MSGVLEMETNDGAKGKEEKSENEGHDVWRAEGSVQYCPDQNSHGDARCAGASGGNQQICLDRAVGERISANRPRPQTHGGVLRQLISTSEEELADIDQQRAILRSQLSLLDSRAEKKIKDKENLESLLATWQSNVSGLLPSDQDVSTASVEETTTTITTTTTTTTVAVDE